MSLEDRVSRLEDREAIKELKYRYGYCIDARRWEEFADLFTEDVQLEYSREGLDDFVGKDALPEYVEAVESQRDFMAHMFHNPVIAVDGDEATGQWYFEAAMTDPEGIAHWAQGAYEDDYRRVEGTWKIARTRTRYNYSTTYEGGWSNEVLEA